MPENYISKQGYVVYKSNIAPSELVALKSELVGKPLQDDKYFVMNKKFTLYTETKNKIIIPKIYGITKYSKPNRETLDYTGVSWKKEIPFVGELKEYQIKPVNLLYNELTMGTSGGILCLATGFGKTVSTINLLSRLKKKTLIIVNKIALLNQWKSELGRFLPGASIGIIQGQNIQVENKDIVITMLQSMSKIDYPDSIFKEFSVTVADETHNFCSKIFSSVLMKVSSMYTIGLTATPTRSDGCEYIFKWFLGDIVYQSKVGTNDRKGLPPIIKLLKIDTCEYKEVFNEKTNSIQFTSMISNLIEIPKRNQLIIELIKSTIMEDSGRKILVLSDRRSHLLALKTLLESDTFVTFTYGLFLGSMKEKDLAQSRSSQVILATFAAFAEGVSEKELNTLILCTPKKYIGHLQHKMVKNESGFMNQVVGRIFRRDHTERNPIIIDLQDNFSVYKTQGKSRVVFYKQHFTNGIFQDEHIDLDAHENITTFCITIKKKSVNIQCTKKDDQVCIL